MKQNTQQTQKISVFKFTFWFPVLYSCITAVLMMLALAIVFSPSVSNEAAARAVLQAAAVSLAISPSALIFNLFLGTKHSKRYMGAPSLYVRMPIVLSTIVMGAQVAYMLYLTIS